MKTLEEKINTERARIADLDTAIEPLQRKRGMAHDRLKKLREQRDTERFAETDTPDWAELLAQDYDETAAKYTAREKAFKRLHPNLYTFGFWEDTKQTVIQLHVKPLTKNEELKTLATALRTLSSVIIPRTVTLDQKSTLGVMFRIMEHGCGEDGAYYLVQTGARWLIIQNTFGNSFRIRHETTLLIEALRLIGQFYYWS